ncbi:GPI anchored serine-threonine rich protein [Zalerion maritima]|uniref:GPI anchored serine-threonine rich protein n=1 Tax=Zalerion maritima TaxID=339359 RepID=A0AAD5WTD1_9PEZI|nr:GPI anchored serine-threonine rich protein [Zalerion maritima]
MRFFAPALLFAASVFAADDECDGQAVLDLCLQTTTAAKEQCVSTDYNCMCEKTRSVYACFASAGCPDDSQASSIYSEMQGYCAYVTTTAVSAAVSTTSSATGTDSTATATEEGDSSATTASSGSSDDDTNSGAYLAMNAGGMMVAIAGAMAAVLIESLIREVGLWTFAWVLEIPAIGNGILSWNNEWNTRSLRVAQ